MASGTINRYALRTETLSITLEANNNVSPFSSYGTTTAAVPTGHIPIITTVYGLASTNPSSVRISAAGQVVVYGRSTGTVNVVIAFLPT